MTYQPSAENVTAALAHAEQSEPMECCGVIADGEYFRVPNQATVHDNFAMDMHRFRDIARKHTIEAVVHSHIYTPAIASDADKSSCELTQLPWLIVSWPMGRWSVIEPSGFRAPLVGRQWAWGSHDCFSLIRDGFESYTGIHLPDFDRDWMFWKQGNDLIRKNYMSAGFVELPQGTPPQHCDIMGMRIHSPVINHLALFLADSPSGGYILHQLQGRLSIREVYGGTYLHATELHLRHQNFMEVPPP
jgi:proteasome lid subunit RPN8/RPN11